MQPDEKDPFTVDLFDRAQKSLGSFKRERESQ